MNTTVGQARDLAAALVGPLSGLGTVETVLCPPFVSLVTVRDALAGSTLGLGAQNCYFAPQGAFTGEISPPMLADLGCRYVILGHSERRTLFGETDDLVRRKVEAAFEHGLTPILCVGETEAEYDAGQTETVVGRQVRAGLEGLTAGQVASLVIAYEPVWAIGTGRAATAAQAGATIGFVRETVAGLFGQAPAGTLRIQYGGSVTPANAADLFARPEIDGALVGGASLRAADFEAICRAAGDAGPQRL
jgi:triosephosphate isomerase